PRSRLHSSVAGYERVVIQPLAHRISVPSWCGIGGQVPPVRPDNAPGVVMLVQDGYLVPILKNFDHPEFEKIAARHPRRVTIVHRVVYLCHRELPHSGSWLILLARFLTQRRVRHVMSKMVGIVGVLVRAVCLDALLDAPRIPNPGQVTLWRGC